LLFHNTINIKEDKKMAKWKQMKMIVGSIMVGALLMPTMSITAWANAETEVTVDNFESEILPNLAIKEDGTPLKVAITVAELDSEYVIAVQKYAQYLLETAGAEVTVSSADGDVENQCNQIYDFIEKGVDVVLIQAADSNAVAPAVKACNEAGVTAIAVGRAINGDCTVDYSALIDDVAMGKLAAEYVADNAGEGATVTTMQGTLGTASADDRTTGFAEGVEEYGLDDIRDNPCDWSSESSMAAMNDILTTNEDIDAVFLHSDCMLAGVISGLTQSEKLKTLDDPEHVMIVSIDGAASAMDYIRQEYVDMTVDNSPLALATIAVKAVLTKTVKGEELGGGVTKVNASVITKDNVDEAEFWGNFDLEDGYWSETANTWNTYAIE
jgi:ribose transport system substrate-binding protein